MDKVKDFIKNHRNYKDKFHSIFLPKLDDEVDKFSMGMGHFMIMLNLSSRKDNPIITVLAKELSISHPTMTYLVDYLENKHFVLRRRDDKDRRAIRISLTKKGKDLIKNISCKWEKKVELFLNRMENEDRETFMTSINNIVNISSEYNK